MTSTEHGHRDDAQAVVAFIAKWRAREPEMAFAEVFCPRTVRARFGLWGALVFEWREAAFELSDARPTEVKCSWWADESLRCAQDAPRHPLTVALSMPGLPWHALARGLSAMADAEPSRPVDREAALASVAPLADAVAMVEGALFDAPSAEDAKRAVAVHLLGERLRIGLMAADGGRVPLSLLARHGLRAQDLSGPQGEPAACDWARELAAALPSQPFDAALYRRACGAFDGWHLRERAAGRTRRMPSLRALTLAWRSARQATRTG
ncbi:MAG TPA: hypothetical protein VK753_13855 [Xanthomonadaceae bacterium]|nr:hypothetical protein [Xanthomonadaceae bacterium]